MVNDDYGVAVVIIPLVSVVFGLIGCIISFLVIGIILHHLHHHHLKREEKITLLMSFNIYFCMLIYVSTLVSFSIQNLIGHNNEISSSNLSWCIFNAYLSIVAGGAMFQNFIVQALFRLGRIVYPNRRWYRQYWLYIIAAPIQLSIEAVLQIPSLLWQSMVYLPAENYCFLALTPSRGILWAVLTIYGFAAVSLPLIYIRITFFIRRQSNNLTAVIKRRQERDLVAIKRIFTNVGLIVVVGLPGSIFLLMFFISGVAHPLIYRVMWIGAEVATGILSVMMVFMSPQLKRIIFKRGRLNRITTVENATPMRTLTATQ